MPYPFFPNVPDLPGIPAVPRFPSSAPQLASFTAMISGNLMNMIGAPSGPLYAGATLSGSGLIDGTRVLRQLSGAAGQSGQYLVDVAQTFSGAVSGVFQPPDPAGEDSLATQDAPEALPPPGSSQWGIFDSQGNPVVIADNVVTVECRQEWAISNYQVEEGAFESYDKVYVPFDARVRFSRGGSIERRQELIDSIDAIAGDLNFYDVVTPEKVWESANIIHQSVSRSAKDGVGLVKADVWLEQVKANATATFSTPTPTTPPIKNPKNASATSKKNVGTVQASTPPDSILSTFRSLPRADVAPSLQ